MGRRPPRSCVARAASEGGDPVARSAAAYARDLGERWDAAGVVLIERDGEIGLERVTGATSRVTGAVMRTDTQFAIGSVTKAWTAWLIRDAARTGAVPIDSTLGRWLPEHAPWRDITIQQLLDHRSGIIRTVKGAHEARTPAEAAALCAKALLLFTPGSAEAYSNCGYEVLARVLEIQSGGRSFAQILQERLLDPWGMAQSGLGRGVHLAAGYTRDAGKTVPAKPSPASGGAGGGYSTARDLCQFLLAARDQAEVASPAAVPAASRAPVRVQAGKTEGFLAFLVNDVDARTGLVYLIDQDGAPVVRLAADLKRILAGQAVEAPRVETRKVIAGDRGHEDALIGTYQLVIDGSQRVTIERRGGQLGFVDPEQNAGPLVWVGPRVLVPVSPDENHTPEVSSDVEIAVPEVVAPGPVPSIELRVAGGMRLQAKRVPR